MAGVYAYFDPDGHLEFRDGVPDRMFGDSDPEHGRPVAFTIQRASWGGSGLQGHISNGSCFSATCPPNRIATTVVTALGGPQEYIFGNLTICGSQSFSVSGEPLLLRGLTEAQRHLIGDVHTTVCKEEATRRNGVEAAVRSADDAPAEGC